MATQKALRDALRNDITAQLLAHYQKTEPDAALTGSNVMMIPVIDAEGNEWYATITVSIPTGSRDGDAYDGYEEAKAYQLKVAQDAEKAAAKAKAKAEKAAKDAARRAKTSAQK